ncbi:conserved unknown protein [Ectocarpus siliculosus]|uniref:tRNA-5-taurinomethyluridine 2-sulfurtransferase n=1 Tax=Ectocarpus siliculosus TaxID=2880 RepID=D8LTT0_ECTSI|nr:conserved unknown protein [Ectocarpus siliculosus]|eukprot:CBN73977.1 conserved unknown protein [Ectocarpus siliculosus]
MDGGGIRFGAEPEEGEEGGLPKRQQGERRDLKGLKQRVVVGMSGGVDSSVVAMLLHQQGYEVVGVFMRNWDEQDETGSDVCAADTDLEDARRVGYHLGIPVKTVDFSREYWNEVFEPSLQELDRCRTPNMDVACNRFIKFDAFREHALGRMSADFVATGHYARTAPGPGGDWSRPVLRQAEDGNKDQTYFLSGVPSEGLAKVLFPLGGLTKPEVRRLAEEGGLPVARKRESMGVCFVGKRRSWASFISQYLTPSPGNFVCVDTGEVVGRHGGVQLYTVGQKSHLDGMPEKYYVAGLDSDSNSVYVARGADNPSLFARGLSVLASKFSWVAGCPPPELLSGSGSHPSAPSRREATKAGGGPAGVEAPVPTKERQPAAPGGEPIDAGEMEGPPPVLRCEYRSRHRQALLPCGVELLGGGGSGASVPRPVVHVRFDEPAKAIAPGQVVALYKEGICLGGGPILRAEGNCSPALVRSMRPPSSRPAATKNCHAKM